MNKAYVLVGVIMLSLFALGIINIIQNYTTGNELDYYLLKETTTAAMNDSIDMVAARSGITRMDAQKFEESFLLRFASNVDDRRYYDIAFYDMNEVPPKVSIRVKSATSYTFEGNNIQIVTDLTSIIENNNKTDPAAVMLLNNKS